jgi:APA family basic amino acid/polyamine antiporter
MAIVGVIVGLTNGTLQTNIVGDAISKSAGGNELFAAVCATAFAYEGWIIATSINSEIKNAKKNLPIALVLGAVIVVVIYVLYNIAIGGGATTQEIQVNGAPTAFYNVFGKVGGAILSVFIVISCLGTLNGLMVGCTRGLYSIAVRGEGPLPKMFSQVDSETNMPTNSSVFGLFTCGFWLLYFYGANLTSGWFGLFNFDSSELPIITIYAMYIPMIIKWIINEKDLSKFKRFVLPIASILGCLFLVFVAIMSHGINPYRNSDTFTFPVLFYLIIFAVIMIIGFLFSNDFKKLINKK